MSSAVDLDVGAAGREAALDAAMRARCSDIPFLIARPEVRASRLSRIVTRTVC